MNSQRDTLLIVDDMEINRAILRGIFENDYKIIEADNGDLAISLIEKNHPTLAAILLDIVMPVMDGYQVMKEVSKAGYLSEVPVVIITAENSAENEVQVFDMGASDIIVKPFEPHVVKRRVQNIIELNLQKLNQEKTIHQQAEKIRESYTDMVDALSSIIEYRSLETGQHVKRIRLFTKLLLEEAAQRYSNYPLDEYTINMIVHASSMHDIGKIAIPDNILNKPASAGRLTKEEFDIMKTHTTKGCEMLSEMSKLGNQEFLKYAYEICRFHHERWDGHGYPDQLQGDKIPLCAQVVGIADCYDALTNDRCYKKAIPSQQAINMILNNECGVFSPKLLECLKNVQASYAKLTVEYADKTESAM